MEKRNTTFESNHKKLGFVEINQQNPQIVNGDLFRSYIKVLYVPVDYVVTVDFNIYEIRQPALFFINSNQYLDVTRASDEPAKLIYYNRDFYCIQIHDAEVACDGLLFNNIFEVPKVDLSKTEAGVVGYLFGQIAGELTAVDSFSEEMIRTYLKQIIIRSTREWKNQNLANESIQVPHSEHDFFRNFSRLVEIHFREKHSVAEYAELLHLAPKTLSSKFNKLNLLNPNEAIKNRIILEAKRMLIYSDLSIKEIAYQLGYDDPAYFNRMFSQKTETSPAAFRKIHKVY